MLNNQNEIQKPLIGKKALIIGLANERSLAWHIAKHLSDAGAKIGFSYHETSDQQKITALAKKIGAQICLPCDFRQDSQIETLFQQIQSDWKTYDILIHSIAYSKIQDLAGSFVNTSRDGFLDTLNVSVYSLIKAVRCSMPMIENRDFSAITLTHHGSTQVYNGYGVMGVAKSALEASVRYLAAELGIKKITVNAISAGPIETLAASAIPNFAEVLEENMKRNPLKTNITGDDVGSLAAFLCSHGARKITGSIFYVDAGSHIISH